jgi:hypothetical protein
LPLSKLAAARSQSSARFRLQLTWAESNSSFVLGSKSAARGGGLAVAAALVTGATVGSALALGAALELRATFAEDAATFDGASLSGPLDGFGAPMDAVGAGARCSVAPLARAAAARDVLSDLAGSGVPAVELVCGEATSQATRAPAKLPTSTGAVVIARRFMPRDLAAPTAPAAGARVP